MAAGSSGRGLKRDITQISSTEQQQLQYLLPRVAPAAHVIIDPGHYDTFDGEIRYQVLSAQHHQVNPDLQLEKLRKSDPALLGAREAIPMQPLPVVDLVPALEEVYQNQPHSKGGWLDSVIGWREDKIASEFDDNIRQCFLEDPTTKLAAFLAAGDGVEKTGQLSEALAKVNIRIKSAEDKLKESRSQEELEGEQQELSERLDLLKSERKNLKEVTIGLNNVASALSAIVALRESICRDQAIAKRMEAALAPYLPIPTAIAQTVFQRVVAALPISTGSTSSGDRQKHREGEARTPG